MPTGTLAAIFSIGSLLAVCRCQLMLDSLCHIVIVCDALYRERECGFHFTDVMSALPSTHPLYRPGLPTGFKPQVFPKPWP